MVKKQYTKNIMVLIALCALSLLNTETVGAKKTTRPNQPATTRQQPAVKIESYAQALNHIKKMPSNKVITNNAFASDFITLVTSLNLPALATEALLQAGVNFHATWTPNNETTKNTLLSFRNSIQSIVQQAPQEPRPNVPEAPTLPPRPRQPIVILPPNMPAQPVMPIQVPQATTQQLPIADHFITNNLVMILDPRNSETVNKNGAMVGRALTTLYEQVTPIIMTSNILEIILAVKQKVGDQNLRQLQFVEIQHMMSYANQLHQSYSTIHGNFLALLAHTNFDSNNFNCYFHKSEKLVLIIPKQYIRANMPKALNFSLNDQAAVCGFNPTVLIAATDMTTESLMQQVRAQQSMQVQEKQFIPHLTAMFTVQKKGGELISPEQDSKWMIFIAGHGGPAYLVPKASRPRQEQQNAQLVPETAQIAGLKAPDFANLFKFFDKSLNTAYVHYSTCFAGGSNQTFVNETLSLLDVDFIVSAEGLHEGVTKASGGIQWGTGKPRIRLTHQSFAEFFRLLRLFFTDQEKFVELTKQNGQFIEIPQKGKEPRKIATKANDPIIKIIRTISPADLQINQPFVRFPSVGAFTATPIIKTTKNLTQTMVRAHEIEKKPIDFTKSPVTTLIINTPRINVPLNLGRNITKHHTALVTPSPESFTPGYEAMYVFKEINWQDTLQSLLFNLSYLNARMYTQTFVINTASGIWLQQSGLQGNQGTPINNLIIQMKSAPGINKNPNQSPMQLTPLTGQILRSSTVGLNITVAFELNGYVYQSFFAIQDFERPDVLYEVMKQLTFTAIPQQSVHTLASNFLTPQEIAKLAKPITLTAIAEFINAKIDKQDPSMALWSEADNAALMKFAGQRAK